MANAIGLGRARTLVDADGDAVGVTGTALDVNIAGGASITVDSEFPAAATITDNFVNPSTTSVMSMGMVYDGSAWDMLRGTSADGMLVNLGGNNDVTVSGTVTADAGTNLNTSALSTHAKQDTMITHLGEIEGAVETMETTVGTDVSTGPAGTLAVGGTESGGAIQELRVDSDGHLQVDVLSAASTAVTNAGTFAVQSTLQAADGVDIGNVDVASIVPGYGATNLGKREDDAHSNLDTGVMALAVRNDVLEALSGTDGDYSVLQVNKTGALNVTETVGHLGAHYESSTTANSSLKIVAFQFLEDTKFSVLTPATSAYIGNTGGGGDDVADTEVFPQGMTIFGRWTAFTLVSGGRVIAYNGDW